MPAEFHRIKGLVLEKLDKASLFPSTRGFSPFDIADIISRSIKARIPEQPISLPYRQDVIVMTRNSDGSVLYEVTRDKGKYEFKGYIRLADGSATPKSEDYQAYDLIVNKRRIQPIIDYISKNVRHVVFSFDYAMEDLIAVFGIDQDGNRQRISISRGTGIKSDETGEAED